MQNISSINSWKIFARIYDMQECIEWENEFAHKLLIGEIEVEAELPKSEILWRYYDLTKCAMKPEFMYRVEFVRE